MNNPLQASLIRPGSGRNQVSLGQLSGASRSLAIEGLAHQDRSLLVVTPSTLQAENLHQELGFFAPNLPVTVLPDYETLPYDMFSPHRELIANRLAALWALLQQRSRITVVAAETLMVSLPPVDFVLGNALVLKPGEDIDREALRSSLAGQGYAQVSQVMEPGEIAVRGSLMDVFPAGLEKPVRLDFFDQELEALRHFDPQSQRSEEQLPELRLLPARDFPTDEDSIKSFRRRFRDRFEGNPTDAIAYREVSAGRLPGGVESYLPLFFEETTNLFDYLSANTWIVEIDGAADVLEESWASIGERYEQLHGDRERPLLAPDELFINPEIIHKNLKDRHRARIFSNKLATQSAVEKNLGVESSLSLIDVSRSPLKLPAQKPKTSILVVAESPGRREVLTTLLQEHDMGAVQVDGWEAFLERRPALGITTGQIGQGFWIADQQVGLIADSELLPDRPRQKRRRRGQIDSDAIVRQLNDLKHGAPVVHEEYGIGRYLGLSTLAVDEVMTEFLTLEYAGGDKLYVPVQNLHLVSRYTGASPDTAPLHRLGSDQWAKAKSKAAKRIRDVAAELLNVYARRAARRGHAFALEEDAYRQFSMGFPFTETEDQEDCIDQVLSDMADEKPMDRLVCGDVGFGKTEVALRAAFVAANEGQQVAVLVPTTLLARQHHQTFSDRFADWPIKVELLSRFSSARGTQKTLDGLANGSIDIVIGTHKLLQPNVKFKHLGLAIIDEEHRFGVRHKERLKALRADVDVLTLTATPIPRTLNMTLGGLRDLSLIATPPAERLAVRTFVSEWNDTLLRDAVLREMHRGGQTYVVHNRVEDIEKVARSFQELLPEASIQIAHGQMPESKLEPVMLDFYHRRFDILVCTTIIESGIDVPAANTIIIHRADRFGLAQLHQLRGRVGRSHHQAYAYLITPPIRSLSADAAKRLEAIEALEDLGAGFTLATHDLEIRGAGELLGDEQSGQIQEIGFSLYNELLERAVEALKSGQEPDMENPIDPGTEINLGVPALIPDDYMPDVHMRLVHYKRISEAEDSEGLRDLQVELIDRFGLLPFPLKNLFSLTELKLQAAELGLVKVEGGSDGGYLRFGSDPKIDPVRLIDLVQRDPDHYQLQGAFTFRFRWSAESDADRFAALQALLAKLKAGQSTAAA